MVSQNSILKTDTLISFGLGTDWSFEIDYLEVVDAKNLSLITKKTNKMLIAVAVIYKKVRLIDNIVVSL